MTRTFLAAALSALVLTSTTACNRAPSTPSGNGIAAVATAPAGEESANAKFNAYTEGYNKLIDKNWGVRAMFDRHTEDDLLAADPSGEISFAENMVTLDLALAKLKEGRALGSKKADAAAADAAVDAVMAPAGRLLAHWKALTPYFVSRAYRDDKLAKYKAADASLKADYQATLAAIDGIDAALTRYQRAETQERIAQFKADGNMPLFHAASTMQLADVFTTAVIDGKIAEADRLLPQLDAAWTQLGAAHTAMPADAANRSEVGSLHGYVGQLIGDYRDFKQSGEGSDVESLVGHYNDAIEEYGDIEIEVAG